MNRYKPMKKITLRLISTMPLLLISVAVYAADLPFEVGDDFHALQMRTIPSAYPKGTLGFYIMKHELSQGFYRDFLNTLTRYYPFQIRPRVG